MYIVLVVQWIGTRHAQMRQDELQQGIHLFHLATFVGRVFRFADDCRCLRLESKSSLGYLPNGFVLI